MKIKSTREQNEIKDICLKERLELIVPKVLKESKADMWIVASKEYHEDLVFDSLTPASYLTARRITMLVFVKAGNEVKRLSLSMPDGALNSYYPQYWKFGEEEQMEALNRLLVEYDPQNIAINISEDHTYADGLSYGLYQTFLKEIKAPYNERFMVDAMIPIKTMEIRTPTEFTLYPELMSLAFSVIEEAFSLKVIEPGKTTCQDVEYFMMDRVTQSGLQYWFSPTIDLQREGHDGIIYDGVIEKGDLLHCDFGIKYLNLCSDTQRLAYVAKDEDEDVPQWMKDGFKVNNRFQDIVGECMADGKSGNDVLVDALNKAHEEGIDACLYSHPCNIYGHGPGTTIGLWNNQNPIPIRGDILMSYDTVYALELNIKYVYEGIQYTICSEETVSFTKDGLTFLYPNRDKIYFIK
ncbi:MAG: aminopeptidase P family protein [Coprobacillus sp.]|nr:aminopeptidase P family protein [Coprobacillus sp.]MCI9092335.1 aminopeptidase P family protein [Coprobacillus sp.]